MIDPDRGGMGIKNDSDCDWSCANFECNDCVQCNYRVTSDSQSDEQQVLVNSDPEDCPPWFYFDLETQTCKCVTFYAARCSRNKPTC